jgi:hypothetical protein
VSFKFMGFCIRVVDRSGSATRDLVNHEGESVNRPQIEVKEL